MGGANSANKNSTDYFQKRKPEKPVSTNDGPRATTTDRSPPGQQQAWSTLRTSDLPSTDGFVHVSLNSGTRPKVPEAHPDVVLHHRHGTSEPDQRQSTSSGSGRSAVPGSSAMYRSEMNLDDLLEVIDVTLPPPRPTFSFADRPQTRPEQPVESMFQRRTSPDLLSDLHPENLFDHCNPVPTGPRSLMSIPVSGQPFAANIPVPFPWSHSQTQLNLDDDLDDLSTHSGIYGNSTSRTHHCSGEKGLSRKHAFKNQPNLLDIGDFSSKGGKERARAVGPQNRNVPRKNRGGRVAGQRGPKPKEAKQQGKVMAQERLLELSARPVREMLFTLQNFSSGFISLLRQPEFTDDVLILVTKVLAQVSQDKQYPCTTRALLQTVLYTPFIGDCLPRYLQTAPHSGSDVAPVLTEVWAFFERLLQEFGSEAEAKLKRCRTLARKAIQHSIDRDGDLDRDLKQALIRAQKDPGTILERLVEAFYPNEDPVLKTSSNHKLNLLRELQQNLEKSLSEVIRRPSNASGIIYQGVHIIETQCSPHQGLIHKLCWSRTCGPVIPWTESTSLLLGSVVFLARTEDGPYHCATVVQRDLAELDQGLVWVRLLNRKATMGLYTETGLIMVETFVYDNDCWSVMAGLQASQEVPLPFQYYFDGQAMGIRHPAYLDCDTTYILEDFDAPVRVLDKRNWPVSESEQDLQPLKQALTMEVALVQSLPGSRAVQFGRKVLRTIIDNDATIQSKCPVVTPVLVLCHSDMILDQVLQGVLDHVPSTAKLKMVRVGGQSTIPDLNGYELHHQRNLMRDMKLVPVHVGHIRKVLYEKLRKFQVEVNAKRQVLEQAEKHILNLATLRPFIADNFQQQLKNTYVAHDPADPLLKWLTFDMYGNPLPGAAQRTCNPKKNIKKAGGATASYARFLGDREVPSRVEMFDPEEFVDLENCGRSDPPAAKNAEDFIVKLGPLDNLELWDSSGKNFRVKDLILVEVQKTDTMSQAELATLGGNITTLSMGDRWRLYRSWLAAFRNRTEEEISAVHDKYEKAFLQLQEVGREMDVHVLQQASVIGMTAAASAQYHSLLQIVAPRIVLVLEASRISEAHAIAALSDQCQHLILIGDHQQLKPQTGNFWLRERFIGISEAVPSIFEVLLNSGMPSAPLSVPEMRAMSVRKLVEGLFPDRCRPTSPVDSTLLPPDPVRGMNTSVFFLNHNDHPESSADTPGSFTNKHEANFLLSLFRYLLQQGYQSSQMTMMAAHAGQVHVLEQLAKKHLKVPVECVTVEEYSGRCNDIVLLSMVRSNDRLDAGRLADQDFIYVALTRARLGLYCIGDFRMLAAAVNLWKTFVTFLAGQQWYGSALVLRCVHHPTEVSTISSLQELQREAASSNRNCRKTCGALMPCGHHCPRLCHSQDRGHEQVHCKQPCLKLVCAFGHQCNRKCSEECSQCTVPVACSYPCGHLVTVSCHERALTTTCPKPCEKRLRCGHQCPKTCGEQCDAAACTEMTEHHDPVCKHLFQVTCSQKQSANQQPIRCHVACTAILPCGHQCQGSCGQCRQGRMHVPCTEPCERLLVCGHQCRAPCGQDCPPCKQVCGLGCPHGSCQLPCGQPCVPCSEPCQWKCIHFRCSRMCFETCDRPRCDAPCKLFLPCRHQCTGLCGEPCPPVCRSCDREKLQAGTFGTCCVDDARYVWLEDCEHAVEVSKVDRLMSGTGAVGAKRCPVCGRTVRRSLRYGNTLKEVVADVAELNRLYEADPAAVRDGTERLRRTVDTFTDLTFHGAEQQLRHEYSKRLDGREQEVLENKLRLLVAMLRLWQAVDGESVRNKFIVHDKLSKLQQWHQQLTEASSRRQLGDVAAELRLVAYFVYLLKAFPVAMVASLTSNQQILYSYIHKRLTDHSAPVADFDCLIVSKLRELCKLCNQPFDETAIDQVQITNVWSMASGHWWKCSKGHIYHVDDTKAETMPQCGKCQVQ